MIAHDTSESVTKCVFFGRVHPCKGIHLLIKALHQAPHLQLRLDIYGVGHDDKVNFYEKQIYQLAQGDQRISFCDPIPPEQVPEVLQRYDFLVVPSQILETGPLVVLEAFSVGVPVICPTNRGSFSELISDGLNGLLIEPNSVKAWVNVFRKLVNDPALPSRLRAGIRQPKTMDAVADEMMNLYLSSNDRKTE